MLRRTGCRHVASLLKKKVLVFEINPHYMEIFANRPVTHRPLPTSLPAIPPWLPATAPFVTLRRCPPAGAALRRHPQPLPLQPPAAPPCCRPLRCSAPPPLPPITTLPPLLCAASLPPRPSSAEARVADPGCVIQAADLADSIVATAEAVTTWRRGAEA